MRLIMKSESLDKSHVDCLDMKHSKAVKFWSRDMGGRGRGGGEVSSFVFSNTTARLPSDPLHPQSSPSRATNKERPGISSTLSSTEASNSPSQLGSFPGATVLFAVGPTTPSHLFLCAGQSALAHSDEQYAVGRAAPDVLHLPQLWGAEERGEEGRGRAEEGELRLFGRRRKKKQS